MTQHVAHRGSDRGTEDWIDRVMREVREEQEAQEERTHLEGYDRCSCCEALLDKRYPTPTECAQCRT